MEEIKTLYDVVQFAARNYAANTAFRYKKGRKEIEEKSYAQFAKDVQAVSHAVLEMGMIGKQVALLGTSSYEWIVCYFGICNCGAVAVPLDAQLSKEALTDLLRRADAEALFYGPLYEDTAAEARKNCPKIREFVTFWKDENAKQDTEQKNDEFDRKYLTDILAKSLDTEKLQAEPKDGLQTKPEEKQAGKPQPDQLCTILFTSGTTGKSKGVMLSHRNLTDNATCLDMKIPQGTVSMSILPINHVYCLTMDIIKGLYIGLSICINDSLMHVQKNLKLFRPEIMLVVPMVLESIYAKLESAEKIIPKKLLAHEVFGGRLKTICSGGAYLDPAYIDRFKAYGITILQGYGMTENSPVISTNLAWANRTGSVGKLLPNCEAKITDGEIWVRGTSVMQGYYHMPEETKEALTEDGWLRTGDLGYLDEDGYLFITGRCKNLIILSNGENVSPEELENLLLRNRLIKEVVVRGFNQVIEAEIFPDEDVVKKKHIKDVKQALQEAIDACNHDLPAYKRISRIKLRETEFPKTTTRKIKR